MPIESPHLLTVHIYKGRSSGGEKARPLFSCITVEELPLAMDSMPDCLEKSLSDTIRDLIPKSISVSTCETLLTHFQETKTIIVLLFI